MMLAIKPTRGELLHTKKRIVLAKRGHDLLKKKQDSLIIEFFKLLKEVQAEHDLLRKEYAHALQQMNEIRIFESDLRIKAAGLVAQQSAPLQLQIRNIAGVKLPSLQRPALQQQPVYSSLSLQEVGNAYIGVVERAIRLGAKETALRKLIIEIRKTKRRAHALEHILIPQLTAAVDHIKFELEERERENFSRLKHKKA